MRPSLPAAELAEAVDLSGDWSPLRKARIFITGGTGFFGKWLLEALGAANDRMGLEAEATVLSRDPRRFLAAMPHLAERPWLKLHPGDVTSFAFPEGAFTHLLHGAASSDARDYAAAPSAMRRVLVAGAERVMDFAARQRELRMLLLSSGAVYGPQPSQLTHLPETHPLPPDTDEPSQAYAQGKREAERIAATAAESLGFLCPIARCFAFAGPHLPLDQHFAFGNFIRDALAGGPIRVTGDGTPMRSYLYASDLAAWIWALLLRGGSRPYNVGSDEDLSIHALAEAIAAAAGVGIEAAGAPEPARPIARYVPDIRLAGEELGLRPRVRLDEAIARTLRWHQEGGAA